MAACPACRAGDHAFCAPVPDPDREMTFAECTCLHDPVLTQRDAQVTALRVAAQTAFGRGDDEATKTALRRCLAVLAPGRTGTAQATAPTKPMRKLALCGRTTDQEYAAASGEPIPEWMQVKHDGGKR